MPGLMRHWFPWSFLVRCCNEQLCIRGGSMTAFLLPRAVGGGLRRAGRSIRGLPVSALAEPLRSYILIVTSLAIGVCSFVAAWSQWKPEEVLIFAGVIACGFVAI